MRVQVRKCPFTGKLFEEKDRNKYIEHLSKLRTKMQETRKYDHTRETWKKWLDAEKDNIIRVEEIPVWFLNNQRKIMDICNVLDFNSKLDKRNRFLDEDKFVSLQWDKFQYDNNASNSHRCPDNGVMNWCSKDKDKPTGYPAFTGYLSGSLVRPEKSQYSSYPYKEALNRVGIKTGTGGGPNHNFEFEFTVFLADWPRIAEGHVLDALKGEI